MFGHYLATCRNFKLMEALAHLVSQYYNTPHSLDSSCPLGKSIPPHPGGEEEICGDGGEICINYYCLPYE